MRNAVAEMAHHLVRRHPSPATGAVRTHRPQPSNESRPCRAAAPASSWIRACELRDSAVTSPVRAAARRRPRGTRPARARGLLPLRQQRLERGVAAQRVELRAVSAERRRHEVALRDRALQVGRAPCRARRRRRAAIPPGRSPPGRPESSAGRAPTCRASMSARAAIEPRHQVLGPRLEDRECAAPAHVEQRPARLVATSGQPQADHPDPIVGARDERRRLDARSRSMSPVISSVCSRLVGTFGSSRRASACAAIDSS